MQIRNNGNAVEITDVPKITTNVVNQARDALQGLIDNTLRTGIDKAKELIFREGEFRRNTELQIANHGWEVRISIKTRDYIESSSGSEKIKIRGNEIIREVTEGLFTKITKFIYTCGERIYQIIIFIAHCVNIYDTVRRITAY